MVPLKLGNFENYRNKKGANDEATGNLSFLQLQKKASITMGVVMMIIYTLCI